ncbi:MAG: type II secretion system protein N [Casimicrobiaceae bacterium]
MQRLIAIIAGLLLVAGIGVSLAPATLADGRLAAATNGALRLQDARGTVWRGEGVLTDARASWQLPFAWTIDATTLPAGELRVALAPVGTADEPGGVVGIAARQVSLRDVRATLPAQALAAALPMRNAPALGGDVNIDAPSFRWTGTAGDGALSLRWTRARIATGAGRLDLGTVDVAIAPQGSRLAGRVSNAGGEVRVTGTLGLSAEGNDGDLTITPLPDAPPAMLRALATLATPDASGAVRLTWRNRNR